jgi:20S proteasome subunit beta 4
MDCTFAIQGDDYILLANDKSVMRSIMKLQDSDVKTIKLTDHQLLSCVGEHYDRKNFSKLIKCNLELYNYQNGNRLNTEEVASYVRSQLAESIRRNPYQANVLIAGYDNDGPKLYWLDYLGSIVRVAKAAHGYGAYFLYGLMDNYYKKGFNYNDGVDVIKKCIKELKTRFLVNMCEFDVFKITKDGIEDVSEQFKEKN